MDDPRTDRPGTNADPDEITRKTGLLTTGRVRDLTAFVEELRRERPDGDIPWFDPTQAGPEEARVLLLLEAPGRKGASRKQGSGFISPDNADPTARSMWHLMQEAELDRRMCVHWNVVPWYLGDERRIAAAGSADVAEAADATRRLLKLLPGLRVVVLMGKAAVATWPLLGLEEPPALETSHPSPRNLAGRPHLREHILQTLVRARELAAG